MDDLAHDPELRAKLEVARAWGVSFRRWCGWEPRRETVYIYDGLGRVVRAVTTVEPEWDDTDRYLALALAAYEADLCPGCSQPMSETTAAENEGRYKPAPAVRCHRCTATAQASTAYQDSPHPSALFIPVELSGRDEDAGDVVP